MSDIIKEILASPETLDIEDCEYLSVVDAALKTFLQRGASEALFDIDREGAERLIRAINIAIRSQD